MVSSDNDKECIMGLNSVVLGGGGSTVSALDNAVVAAGIVGSWPWLLGETMGLKLKLAVLLDMNNYLAM